MRLLFLLLIYILCQGFTVAELGTIDKPYKRSSDVPRDSIAYGNDAIEKVKQMYGIDKLTLAQRRVIEEEGFVNAYYQDDKGIKTYGVGQTEKYFDTGFIGAFDAHAKVTKKYFNNFDMFDERLQAELIQLSYRGDIQQSPTFRKYMNAKEYDKAAVELLKHDEYIARKAKGNDGVTRRLEKARDAILNYSKGQRLKVSSLGSLDYTQSQKIMGDYFG